MHCQLKPFLDQHNILEVFESGFKIHHSTESALLRVLKPVRPRSRKKWAKHFLTSKILFWETSDVEMKKFSDFFHFSKFLGKCCKFATLGIVGSRTVWRHLQAFLPEWIQPRSEFVLLFHLWHSQVVYHTKRNTCIPPEHLQVHIQDHSHLSLNNATGIPPTIAEHSEPVFLSPSATNCCLGNTEKNSSGSFKS